MGSHAGFREPQLISKPQIRTCFSAFDLSTEETRGALYLISGGMLHMPLIFQEFCFEFCWLPWQLPNKFVEKKISPELSQLEGD